MTGSSVNIFAVFEGDSPCFVVGGYHNKRVLIGLGIIKRCFYRIVE